VGRVVAYGRAVADLSQLDGLVDVDRLDAWIGARLPGEGDPLGVTRITTGHSNEVFELRRGEHRWILRRPPRVPLSKTAHDMMREFRVLTALEDSAVPHATPLVACEDPGVIGAPFYIMEPVDGFVVRDSLPPPFDVDIAARLGLGTELVDALAELTLVDWRASGLEGFGKPARYLERQVQRWLGQLAGYKTRELPDLEWVAPWLAEHTPTMGEPAILHGDYKLDNVIFGHGAPAHLAAVVDWEQATIADPLVDLGWMLALWDEPGEEPLAGLPSVTQLPGFPRRDELAARYGGRTGRDLEHLTYYKVLSLFKLACILEGSYYRFVNKTSDDPMHGIFEAVVPALARRARALAQGGTL
jgi:aminoglycoside phosphotransferase (APT) family kinase protein